MLNIVGTGVLGSTEGNYDEEAGREEKSNVVALVVLSSEVEVDVAVMVEASHWRQKRLLRGPPSGIMEVRISTFQRNAGVVANGQSRGGDG